MSWFIGNLWRQSIDRSLTSLKTITEPHARIHAGDGYISNAFASQTLAAANSVWFVLETGPDPIHLSLRTIELFEGHLEVSLYNSITGTFTGTPTLITACNLNEEHEPGLVIRRENTVNVSQADLRQRFRIKAPEGNPSVAKNPVAQSTSIEQIYKPNEKYALELKNVGSSGITFWQIFWFWYVGR